MICKRCKATCSPIHFYPVGAERVPVCDPCYKDLTQGSRKLTRKPAGGEQAEMFPELVRQSPRKGRAGA